MNDNDSKQTVFWSTEILTLCDSIKDIHRALKTIGMIFSEFDFNDDNGNAFQGQIQRTWFKSIIEEMINAQYSKLNQIIEIYKIEQSKLI